MKNKPKSKEILATDVPGLIAKKGSGAIALTASNLPSSSNFFFATDFDVKINVNTLDILFVTKSSFEGADSKPKLAVELIFPVCVAVEFLHKSIWERPRLGGAEAFGIFLETEIKSNSLQSEETAVQNLKKSLEIPQDSNCYRKFPTNFMTVTSSMGQGMLEFFEVPPDLIATAIHGDKVRPNASVKSIISVITSQHLLMSFLKKTKDLLEPYTECNSFQQESAD